MQERLNIYNRDNWHDEHVDWSIDKDQWPGVNQIGIQLMELRATEPTQTQNIDESSKDIFQTPKENYQAEALAITDPLLEMAMDRDHQLSFWSLLTEKIVLKDHSSRLKH